MKDLLSLCHCLAPFVVGAEGNASAKIDDGFLIKASGTSLAEAKHSTLVQCYLNGTSKPDQRFAPSMEAGFHSYLYSQFDVSFIAHTHPTNTVKVLCTDLVSVFANKRLFPDQVIYNGPKSCVVPYATPGKDLESAIHKHLKEFLNENHTFPKLILLQNHGIICCGTSIKECIYSTEICEKSASILLQGGHRSDEINFLNQEEIFKLSVDENEKYRQKLITA